MNNKYLKLFLKEGDIKQIAEELNVIPVSVSKELMLGNISENIRIALFNKAESNATKNADLYKAWLALNKIKEEDDV